MPHEANHLLLSPRMGQRTAIGQMPQRSAASPKAVAHRHSLPTQLNNAAPRGGSSTLPQTSTRQTVPKAHPSSPGRTGSSAVSASPVSTNRLTGMRVASSDVRSVPSSPAPVNRNLLSPGPSRREGRVGTGQVSYQPPPQTTSGLGQRPSFGSNRPSLASRNTSRDSRAPRSPSGCSMREGSQESLPGRGRVGMADAFRIRPPSPTGLSWVNDGDDDAGLSKKDSESRWAQPSRSPGRVVPRTGPAREVGRARQNSPTVNIGPPRRLAGSRMDVGRTCAAGDRSVSRDSAISGRSASQTSRASSIQSRTSRPLSTTRETCFELQQGWKTARPSAPSTQAKATARSTATSSTGPSTRGMSSSSTSRTPSVPSSRATSPAAGTLRTSNSGPTTRRNVQSSPVSSSRATTGSVTSRLGNSRGRPMMGRPAQPTSIVNAGSKPKQAEDKSENSIAQSLIQQVQRLGANRTQQNSSRSVSNNRAKERAQSRDVNIDLQRGAEVVIDGCVCTITDALGMGSFGTVWEAVDPAGTKLAIKEIPCMTQNELMNALFEKHLLGVLSTPRNLPQATLPKIPALVGHEVLCSQPSRVRLAMSRVPGIPLEDFLDDRRHAAAVAASSGNPPSPQDRFEDAVTYTHALLAQLSPVFERISAVACHRDVNTQNILIDTKSGSPQFGLVDFGLAVDSLCWCSTEDNPETKFRPTRIGQDSVHTWKYLDIAGDCRYWPVSAWTQFLLGWREIQARDCLLREYMHQLDQHALGITVMKVFSELLSPPPPKDCDETHGNDDQGSGLPQTTSQSSLEARVGVQNLQLELWSILRSWERYWKRVAPIHKKLTNTFHHGGDWDVLKQLCEDTCFYAHCASDLAEIRRALSEAATSCLDAVKYGEQSSSGKGDSIFSKAAKMFQAMLLLVSDGVTQDMLAGPEAWQSISRILCGTEAGASDSTDVPTTATCSSTASTTEAPPGKRKDVQAFNQREYFAS